MYFGIKRVMGGCRGYIGIIGCIGLFRDNGKEHGNNYIAYVFTRAARGNFKPEQ